MINPSDATSQQAALHQAILQTMADGYWLVDTQGRLLEVNDAYCRMSGYSRQELLGMSIYQLEALENAGDVATHIQKIITMGTDRFESLHRSKDGRLLQLELSVTYLPVDGGRMVSTVREIGERKAMEQALRSSEAAFRGYFNMGTVGMCVTSPQKGWVAVNDRLCQMLGRTAEELASMTWADLTHPDDLHADLERFNRVLAGEIDTYQLEKRFIHKTGQVIHTMLSVTCQRNPDGSVRHLLASLVDITARKQAELQVSALHQRLELACQAAGLGIWDWDVVTNRICWDEQMYAIYGLPASTPISQDTLFQMIHPEDRFQARRALLRARAEHTQEQIELRIIRPDGEIRHVFAAEQVLLNAQGQASHVIGVTFDITRHKQTEIALRQQYEALEEAQQRLVHSEKLASVGKLVAGVAHELNNPLTSVILFSQLVQHKYPDPAIQGDLEKIVSEAQRAARIVRGLLDFARQRAVDLKPTEINRLLNACIELVAHNLQTSRVEVRLQLAPDIPLTLADPQQMQQVFLNLISNACQAIAATRPSGRLMICSELAPARYQTAASSTEPLIRVTLDDDGPGIPQALLSRIFDPFFSTKPVGQGTGLGLAVCHGIVTEHNGHIWAENRPGGGARFVIELPVRKPEPASIDQTRLPAAEPLPPMATVLVIDDEALILETTARVLRSLGYQVDTQQDGAAAILQMQRQRYDLILCDFRMPGVNGAEIYRRAQLIDPDLPQRILFVTGDTIGLDAQNFFTQTHAPRLSKPFHLEQLTNQVQQILEANPPQI